MKYLKLIAFLLIGFSVVFTSCEDNIDQVIEEEVVVKERKENNLVTRSNFNPEGSVDFGCFTLDYPFSLLTINENEVEITTQEEFEEVLFDTVDYIVDFVYPLEVTYEDGETAIINNIDDLGEAFGSCIPDEGWNDGSFPAYIIGDDHCVSLTYPLNVVGIDGIVYTAESEEELIDLMAVNEFLFFEFPLTVLDNETKDLLEVSNEEDLFESLLSCDDVNQPGESTLWNGQIGCFDIVFPASFNMPDGSVVTIENTDELAALVLQNEFETFAYPLTLVNADTGVEITVNTDEELVLSLFSCSGIVIGNSVPIESLLQGSGTCYDIVFPFNIINYNGQSTQVANLEELESYANQGYFLSQPVVVILPDGSTTTITTFGDLNTLLLNC